MIESGNLYHERRRLHHQPKKRKELLTKKDLQIINMGQVPAFILRSENKLSSTEYIKIINELKQEGIIVFPADEGMGFAGFFRTKKQLELLKSKGRLSVGIPEVDSPSLLYYDHKRKRLGIIGCIPIVSAYRGFYIEIPAGWQMAKKDERGIKAKKDTRLNKIDLEQIQLDSPKHPLNYPNNLPKEIFYKIRHDVPEKYGEVTSIKLDKCYAIKIDTNNFGKKLRNASVTNQIKIIKDNIDFYNELEDQFEILIRDRINIFIGDRTTDSIVIYIANKSSRKFIEKILQDKLKQKFFDIKAVGIDLENVNLNLIDDRVVYSDKSIEEAEWLGIETEYKLPRNRNANSIPSYMLHSHIYFRDDRENSLGYGIRLPKS